MPHLAMSPVESVFSAEHVSRARILARQDMVICGLEVAKRVFQRLDPGLESSSLKTRDGETDQQAEATVLTVEGPTISLLTAERTALNFLQRLTGVATLVAAVSQTRQHKAATGARIVDTQENHTGLAGTGKVRRALRWLLQSPRFPRRTRADQGKPHRGGRLPGKSRQSWHTCVTHRTCAKIEVETENLGARQRGTWRPVRK